MEVFVSRGYFGILVSVLTAAGLLGFANHAMGAGPTVPDGAVKIGVLNDQSGIYADLAGPGSVEAARMAIEDFGGSALGKPIELIAADHQNKADVGAAIARTWYDQDGVDVTVDFSNSSVALAVQIITKDKQKVTLITAASSAITGKACTPNSAQWVYNSHSNGYSLARVLTERGLKSWFLLTVDYAFGHAFAADIRKAVTDAGGTVVGEVRHPLNTADMRLLFASGAGIERQGGGLCQRRQRHDHRHQTGRRVRHRAAVNAAWRRSSSSPTCTRWD